MTTIHNGLETSLGGLASGSTDKTPAAPSADQAVQAQVQAESTGQPSGVSITPTAQLMASLEQLISSSPEVDQSRVDAISQALSQGTYQMNSGRIADGLLAAQTFDAQASAGAGSGAANTIHAFTSTAQLRGHED